MDEAQNLSPDVLEEIRLLTNLETSTEKLLQIVLCGQPELEMKLSQPELRQLKQRITLRSRTYPLGEEETGAYINQRLHVAGSTRTDIFTLEAVEAVYYYSRGIPRVVNLLCEHALISAFADQQASVAAPIIEVIAREFDLEGREHYGGPERPDGGENRTLMDALRTLNGGPRRPKPAPVPSPKEGRA